MLRRLQLVRKLEAPLDDPPGHEPEGRELLAGGRRGLPRVRLVGELGHDALREAPRPRPRLVLVAHDGAHKSLRRSHRRERLTMRDLRLISLLARSCRSLVRSRFK